MTISTILVTNRVNQVWMMNELKLCATIGSKFVLCPIYHSHHLTTEEPLRTSIMRRVPSKQSLKTESKTLNIVDNFLQTTYDLMLCYKVNT